MAKTKAEKAAKLYGLGPQPDGAIVVRIPTDFDLMVLRKAVEKQEKNAGAAGGTLSALADGDDPFLDKVQSTLGMLKNLIARARAPENQIADTPIGKAMAANAAEPSDDKADEAEPIDGHPAGAVWSSSVPRPRPKLGGNIVHPKGPAIGITEILGWSPELGAFNVKAGNAEYGVIAHEPAAGSLEWRIHNEDGYATPRVYPTSNTDAASGLIDEAAGSGALVNDDKLTADAPTSTEDADIVEDTDAGGEPTRRAPAKKSAAKKAAPPAAKPTARPAGKPDQRARNASANGIGARGKRPGGKR